jgi:dihydroorotate dehydrogenase (NAD+) catalytic subunit
MDLSADLGRITLKNALICASSEFTMTAAGIKAALDAGAAAVVAKSVNESPAAARQLDTADYVLLDRNWNIVPWEKANPEHDSLFCRSGLAKTPLKEWLKLLAELDQYAWTKNSYVLGSITVADAAPAAEIAAQMEAAGLRWIELNLSAPHGREASAVRQITASAIVGDYVRQVRQATGLPLAVKLTAQSEDVVALAKEAVANGADMLVMIGRSPGFLPDIETYQPVLGSWGAIGVRWSLPTSLYWVSKCWLALPREVPLIGTNGARCADDAIRFLLSGARAVEFASLVLTQGPRVFTEMLESLLNYGKRKNISRLSELVGKAADSSKSYQSLPTVFRSSYPWDRYMKKED